MNDVKRNQFSVDDLLEEDDQQFDDLEDEFSEPAVQDPLTAAAPPQGPYQQPAPAPTQQQKASKTKWILFGSIFAFMFIGVAAIVAWPILFPANTQKGPGGIAQQQLYQQQPVHKPVYQQPQGYQNTPQNQVRQPNLNPGLKQVSTSPLKQNQPIHNQNQAGYPNYQEHQGKQVVYGQSNPQIQQPGQGNAVTGMAGYPTSGQENTFNQVPKVKKPRLKESRQTVPTYMPPKELEALLARVDDLKTFKKDILLAIKETRTASPDNSEEIDRLTQELADTKQKLTESTTMIEAYKKRVVSLEGNISELKTSNKTLTGANTHLRHLEKQWRLKVEELQGNVAANTKTKDKPAGKNLLVQFTKNWSLNGITMDKAIFISRKTGAMSMLKTGDKLEGITIKKLSPHDELVMTSAGPLYIQ